MAASGSSAPAIADTTNQPAAFERAGATVDVIGGSPDEQAALGEIVGRSLPAEAVAPAIARALDRYLEIRTDGELFIDTVRRLGADPFRTAIYEPIDAAA